MNKQQPPHSLESEIVIIGSLLINSDGIYQSEELINSDMFYYEKHKIIYDTIKSLKENKESIDIISIAEQLKKQNKLKEIGGIPYLSKITTDVPTSVLLSTHCKIVAGTWIKRETIKLAEQLKKEAYDDTSNEFETVQTAQNKFTLITENITAGNIAHIKDLAHATFDEIMAMQEGKFNYIKTPNKLINYLLRGGAKPSKLYGIPALTGQGKSAYIVAWLSECSKTHNSLLYTLEMPTTEFIERITSNLTGIDTYKMEGSDGKLSENEMIKITECFGKYKDLKLWIDDRPSWNIDKLRIDIKKNVKKYGIKIVFIDYLQLLKAKGATINTREQEMSYIANELKAIAKENKISVVVAIQFNRAVGKQRPQLSFLKDSGAIEQALDVCLSLYDYKDHDPSDTVIPYELILLKNRGGRTGSEEVIYDKSLFRFESQEQRQDAVQYYNEPVEREKF